MGKKLSRKEKIELTRKGICWKCKKKTLKKDKKSVRCENCGFEFINF